jgi:small multidrug resistance pump
MEWVYLSAAIACEVGATISLRLATTGSNRWYVAVISGYLAAFGFLTLLLNAGLGLGVAYGIWSAAGVALTAIASRLLFKEPLTLLMSSGIALIIGGVLLIELGGAQ